jgi:hypothetical protein
MAAEHGISNKKYHAENGIYASKHPWWSGWSLRLNISGCGFNSLSGEQYFVLLSGQLTKKAS